MSTPEPNPRSEPAPKRTYEKPVLRIIDLKADEVLAIGCKMPSGGSASGASPCTANFCAQGGS